jgi:hypothetical protein
MDKGVGVYARAVSYRGLTSYKMWINSLINLRGRLALMPDCAFGPDRDNQPICTVHNAPLRGETRVRELRGPGGITKVNTSVEVWVCSVTSQRVTTA